MKRFLGFVSKEFYHILRDVRTLVILICIPIIQLLLFGYVITNDIKDAKIVIYDQSKDNISQKLVQKILSSGYFKLIDDINNYKDIESNFRKGVIKQVIIIEKNFAENLEKNGVANIQIISDASEPNTSNILVNYNIGIINGFLNEINQSNKMPYQIIPEVSMYYNNEIKSVFMFIPGLIALLMVLICALMTSISITREKELGTMEILLVSPLKPIQIIIGKVIPYLLLSFIDTCLILIIGLNVFHIPLQGNIFLLLAECLLYILLALSLGILISTATSSQQIAMMISLVALMLPSILLSGFIFPIENMPKLLQLVCNIMPPKWFIIIVKNIMLKGVGFSYIWKESCILIGMTMLFIFLSVRNFKIRLE